MRGSCWHQTGLWIALESGSDHLQLRQAVVQGLQDCPALWSGLRQYRPRELAHHLECKRQEDGPFHFCTSWSVWFSPSLMKAYPCVARRQRSASQVPADQEAVHRRVDQMRIRPVTLRNGRSLPRVEGLFTESQHPAGHRDGDPVRGKVKDQRELHFGGSSQAKNAAAPLRVRVG